MADELPKKSSDRLREYRDSNLESLKFQLFSPAPLYPELERAKLTASLTFLAEALGGEHELVKLVLAVRSRGARRRTRRRHELFDPAERKKLVDGGKKAIDESKRPTHPARTRDRRGVAPAAHAFETEVEEPERQAYGALSGVRFLTLATASRRTRRSRCGSRSAPCKATRWTARS